MSDRAIDRKHAPIPALLAVAGVHHHLIREGTRTQVSLVLESGEPREVRLSVDADEEKCVLANLLSNDHSEPDASGKHRMLLEPYGYRWFRVCGLDYLLKRTAV